MDILFLAHLLNGLLMIAMPVGLAIYLTRKFHLDWRLLWIGAGTFILSQVGHIPFNILVSPVFKQETFTTLSSTGQLIIRAAFLGLSAGLFEESCRYAMFRWWAKDARTWSKGLLAGLGHGGAEASILGVLVLLAFMQLAILRDADLSKVLPASQLTLAQQQVNAYWTATWFDSLLGAVERLFTIPVQMCLSLLVMQTFVRRQWFWVWLAVLFHALVDANAVLAMNYIGVYWTEAVIGGFAVLCVILILVLRQPEPVTGGIEGSSTPPGTIPALRPVEETPENLENTRYQS